MSTNITEQHVERLAAVRTASNVALFSCFIDGEPGAAIVAITREDDDNYQITPLFVSVTDKMVLTDHDGVALELSP